MLRIVPKSDSAAAKSYYSTADYYAEGQQEMPGEWHGRAAARLGLFGSVKREDWDALCEARHPLTGEKLTPRQNDKRIVCYDMNFHVPKSVSLLYGLTQDERILTAFRESVTATMEDIEREMQTRVRRGGKDSERTTGNMVYAEFTHQTSRPVDGIPDCHLHSHCVVLNVTYDETESRFKAGKITAIKRSAPYFEAVFHARMAKRTRDLGLPTIRTRTGWEIAGINRSTLEKFSRRTALIEETAREKEITDPEEKDQLGAKTRERKQKNLTMQELHAEWRGRLSDEERDAVARVKAAVGGKGIAENERAARDAATHAIEHVFERSSVVPYRKLATEALKRGVATASPEAIEHALESQALITANRNGRRVVTHKNVLAEEKRMLDLAKNGRGTCAPLGSRTHVFQNKQLNAGQRRTVMHVLTSNDSIILIRGRAGTGKTWSMREAVDAIESKGKQVFVFAPSAEATRLLREQEHFENADTVAALLVNKQLQAAVAGHVIWVDEAALLSQRQMTELIELASKQKARLVLQGDAGQHASVERGSALKLLQSHAGLVPGELRDIERQNGRYRDAVAALSDGRVVDAFDILDKDLGWVHEISDDVTRYETMANDYVGTVMRGRTALCVAPTHLEREIVSDAIRSRLKQSDLLGGERRIRSLQATFLTTAQRRDPLQYCPQDVLVFTKNAPGYRKSQKVVVDRVGDTSLPYDLADRYQVYKQDSLPIGEGELIRITRNGQSVEGKRLNNGATFIVAGFTKAGDIKLTNGWTISKDFGFIDLGYAVTSVASQGRTVDFVYVANSDISYPASSHEQAYVSLSRGRYGAHVYCSDKQSLLEAINRSDERLTATELTAARSMAMERDFDAEIATRNRLIESEREHSHER